MQAVREALRSSTAAAHARVEAALGLLDPELTRATLADALAVLHGFWRPAEDALDGWAHTSPALAAELDWPRRRRCALQHDDLIALGVRPETVPLAPAVLTGPDDAQALAWLYVAEGSTLGGAVVHRALAAGPVGAGLRLTSLTPYAEGPGPMWRRYLDVTQDWAGTDSTRLGALVGAAVTIFDALAGWAETAAIEDVA